MLECRSVLHQLIVRYANASPTALRHPCLCAKTGDSPNTCDLSPVPPFFNDYGSSKYRYYFALISP